MHYVASSDGVRLAVHEHGPADAPVVVAVHGYPDNHSVWDGVAKELADRYRVVAYDVRGCGDSDRPARRSGYRIEQLTADLRAVLDAVSPDAPVHLLAHDWGSIQTWASVTDPALRHRIASYVSISGPSLDMAAAWLRDLRHRPGAKLRQLLHSYYVLAFQLPVLPEALWRSGALDRLLQDPTPRPDQDKINGLELYRANALGRLTRPRPGTTAVPVLVLAPEQDGYVTVPLQTEAPIPYVANLTTRTIPGDHWVVAARPDLIASLTDEFIRSVG